MPPAVRPSHRRFSRRPAARCYTRATCGSRARGRRACAGLLYPWPPTCATLPVVVARGDGALWAPQAAPRRLQAGCSRAGGGPPPQCGQRCGRDTSVAPLWPLALAQGAQLESLLDLQIAIKGLPYMVRNIYTIVPTRHMFVTCVYQNAWHTSTRLCRCHGFTLSTQQKAVLLPYSV